MLTFGDGSIGRGIISLFLHISLQKKFSAFTEMVPRVGFFFPFLVIK